MLVGTNRPIWNLRAGDNDRILFENPWSPRSGSVAPGIVAKEHR